MGNSNIKQTSQRVLGDSTVDGKINALGGISGTDAVFTGDISAKTADVSGKGKFGSIDVAGDTKFASISSQEGKFGNISGTSLALQKGNTVWGFNITDQEHLCITQNGANLTCINKEGVLY